MKFLTFLTLIFTAFLIKADPPIKTALEQIDEQGLVKHIKILASDEFLGRAPAHEGEIKTLEYLTGEFQKLGLKPGNGNSYLQPFDLVEVHSKPLEIMEVKGEKGSVKLNWADEFVAQSSHLTNLVEYKDAEIVFAGYGITAPEYNWFDYGNIDVKGKVVIVMVNDPGYHTKNTELFTGNAMTYYGRWTYKYEEAARQGAAGLFIIHEDGAASYPWAVVRNGWTGEEFYKESTDSNFSRAKVNGWINLAKAQEIFSLAGYDFDEELKKASSGSYKGLNLNLKTSMIIENKFSNVVTNNVIGYIPGKKRPEEYIFYMGHWDHLGIDLSLEGDQIYNGARDNASGIAALLEIAEAFQSLDEKPERSIVFLAVGAEERGLLGSAYYVANPIFPLNKTVAAINMDGLNIFGPMNDVHIVGYGQSDLDNYVKNAALEMGKIVKPESNPEAGIYYRSDHFSFAHGGVPAIYLKHGNDHKELGEEKTKKIVAEWTKNLYHKVGDEYDAETWDLRGMVEEVRMLFRIGYQLSKEDTFPQWSEKSEFRKIREKSLADKN